MVILAYIFLWQFREQRIDVTISKFKIFFLLLSFLHFGVLGRNYLAGQHVRAKERIQWNQPHTAGSPSCCV